MRIATISRSVLPQGHQLRDLPGLRSEFIGGVIPLFAPKSVPTQGLPPDLRAGVIPRLRGFTLKTRVHIKLGVLRCTKSIFAPDP